MIKELTPHLAFKGSEGSANKEDPLVTIRMQELAIKQMEAQNKASLEEAKLQLETMKAKQRAVTDTARLDLQEQVADDRASVNRERIDVQRQNMMMKGQQ
jgi:hypothetical protein